MVEQWMAEAHIKMCTVQVSVGPQHALANKGVDCCEDFLTALVVDGTFSAAHGACVCLSLTDTAD
jgi:hypothetical protein